MAGTATGGLGALDIGVRAVTAEVTTAAGAAANVIGLLSEVAVETADQDLLARAEELARQSLGAASAKYRSTIGRPLATLLLDRSAAVSSDVQMAAPTLC